VVLFTTWDTSALGLQHGHTWHDATAACCVDSQRDVIVLPTKFSKGVVELLADHVVSFVGGGDTLCVVV
jgi:hypothetical protein